MARQLFEYDPPERFVAGTVGDPGSRTFFLQASSGTRLTSIALEKAQVGILAERIDELLDEVLRRNPGLPSVPSAPPATIEDSGPLQAPIDEEFRVGTMSLAWEIERQKVIIECYSEGLEVDPEGEQQDEQDGAVLRVALDGVQARAFSKRALAVVAAGRPPCPFCEGPLDPQGHICPRANGYRR